MDVFYSVIFGDQNLCPPMFTNSPRMRHIDISSTIPHECPLRPMVISSFVVDLKQHGISLVPCGLSQPKRVPVSVIMSWRCLAPMPPHVCCLAVSASYFYSTSTIVYIYRAFSCVGSLQIVIHCFVCIFNIARPCQYVIFHCMMYDLQSNMSFHCSGLQK